MKIVWFSEIKWSYLRTRKQQIIARRPAGVQLLFLEPYVRSRANPYRLREEDGIFCATVPFVKSAPGFPWRNVLALRSVRGAVDLFARKRIERIVKQLSFVSPTTGFITSNIFAADIISSLPRRFLVYDCNDDHSSFPGMEPWTRTYFDRTCRDADAVFASSSALLEKVTTVREGPRGCSYLGNGVDYERFQRNGDGMRRSTGEGRPRLGYIGAVAPWLDFDALADLARRRPEWDIVLVGPVLLGVEDQLMRLTALPNVSHMPAVPYDDVPGVLARFTLGLIPFRYNELTRGVNPNKMYEYLACGLPVVTTRFSSEVERHPGVVAAADPGADFFRACEAFVETVSRADTRAEFSKRAQSVARDNDWKNIAAEFWRRVEEIANRS